MPKKSIIYQTKCRDHPNLLVVNNEPLFFQFSDGVLIPTLRVLHKCKLFLLFTSNQILVFAVPEMMPKVQVDKGAIKFVLSGADIMCPGLTSAGGHIPADLLANAIVVS